MSSSADGLALAKSVRCDDKLIYVTLTSGRVVTAPLTERLAVATQKQRDQGYIDEFGTALRWEDIDEDLGLNSILGVTEDEIYDLAGFKKYP